MPNNRRPSWRVMIVDDEPDACQRLEQLVKGVPQLTLVAVATSVSEAAALFVEHQPNIILLDIEMPHANGFELLPTLVPVPKIIFITAYREFAIRAFEVNAVDYLLKPVFPERFAIAINRVLQPDLPSVESPAAPFHKDDLIFFRGERASIAITTKSIICIVAAGNFSHIVAEDQESMVYRNLSQWEQRLPANLFFRVDRSYIVNLSRIIRLVALDRDHTEVHLDGVAVPRVIGRAAAQRLLAALKKNPG